MYYEHLDPSACEQINIDQDTRLAVEKQLLEAGPHIFDCAQKHVSATS